MRALIELVVDLTAHRDRDALDAGLVAAVREWADARAVALHRRVGDEGDLRWLTGARAVEGRGTSALDSTWVDLRALPPLDSEPEWQRCMRQGSELTRADGAELHLLFPLASNGGASGVLEVTTRRPPAPSVRQDVVGLLQVFRNLLALLDYTESDTLTGLLNRKSFDESFYKASALPANLGGGESTERRHTHDLRYWLGVVDIDHFKLVNDQHGHLIGDEVLLLLARVMRRSFRLPDKLYRFGGEEFVVLLRCRDERDATSAFERFRSQVEAFAFPRVDHVTVSIGFTDVRAGDTPNAAVERADLAVYYAKHHGRNQVHSHAALVRAGELTDVAQANDIEFF